MNLQEKCNSAPKNIENNYPNLPFYGSVLHSKHIRFWLQQALIFLQFAGLHQHGLDGFNGTYTFLGKSSRTYQFVGTFNKKQIFYNQKFKEIRNPSIENPNGTPDLDTEATKLPKTSCRPVYYFLSKQGPGQSGSNGSLAHIRFLFLIQWHP